MIDPANHRLAEIFLPYATERMKQARERGSRFVYYTSAATAERILSKAEIWMRNAMTMNDFMETRHGLTCLVDAYRGKPGTRLKEVLAPHFPSLCATLEQRFDGWRPHILTGTFLTCVSEHHDTEDMIGRLSMWRAYGDGSGVALVVNSTPFLTESDALHAYTSPVAYMRPIQFAEAFNNVVDRVASNLDFLRAQGEEIITHWLFNMMRFAVVSTKHPGFAEELEWRVVHSPKLEPSARLASDIEVIRGTPQRVYKIPLRNVPEEGFVGAEIPELIDRIIIGPTQFPYAIADAFHQLLEKAGVKDAGSRIIVSDIPLRPS
jgi:hypothetical protein